MEKNCEHFFVSDGSASICIHCGVRKRTVKGEGIFRTKEIYDYAWDENGRPRRKEVK